MNIYNKKGITLVVLSLYVKTTILTHKKTLICILNTYRFPLGDEKQGEKVKVTPVQALRLCTGRKAHKGSRSIALPFHDHGTRRG